MFTALVEFDKYHSKLDWSAANTPLTVGTSVKKKLTLNVLISSPFLECVTQKPT